MTEAEGPVLAVYAPRFGLVSETFIAEHARTIAPGRTVLLCNDGEGADAFGVPVLAGVDARPTPRGPFAMLAAALRRQWRRRVAPGLPPRDRARVVAFLRAHRVATLLAEYGTSGREVARACAEAGVRLVVHFHGFDASTLLRYPAVRRDYRTMFGSCHAVVTPSRYLADKLVAIGCPEALIRVNPNGVDADRFRPAPKRPGRVIAVGRLVEKKAPHLTIAAFAAAAAGRPQAHLDIVGDGPLRSRCEAEIARLGLADRVTLHGAQPHARVVAMMAEASVFAQHAVTAPDGDEEGFGISLIEAMSCETPVVATRHNGFVETVVEGETGFLVAEGDAAAMGARIAALLDDPGAAARMGAAGRARVLERYTAARARDGLRRILEV